MGAKRQIIRKIIDDNMHVWEGGKVYTRCCWGNLRERNHLEIPSVDERIILRWIFR